MTSEREFYIGYQTRAPAGLSRFLRRAVALLLAFAAALALVLIAIQGRFDPGVFEFGIVRSFEGVILEEPHPMLLVERPGGDGSAPISRFFLVASGKHGAEAEVAGFGGQGVRLEGSLIYREGQTMIEVSSGSVESLGEADRAPRTDFSELGTQTLRGEIVDSKCFFGVMKPGRGKPHRACATRCISGGIPPVLRVETRSGDYQHYLLVDQDATTVNDRVLELVAEPVEITGRVVRRDNLLVLEANPESYRRIGRVGRPGRVGEK